MRARHLVLSALVSTACVPAGAPAPMQDADIMASDAASTITDAGAADRALSDFGVHDDSGASSDLGVSSKRLELELSSSVVAEGDSVALSVWQVDAQGDRQRVSAGLEIIVSTATVAARDLLTLRALAPGRTRVRVELDGASSNSELLLVTPVGELRGVWVSRWLYSNAADLDRIVSDATDANLNAIFLQVRGEADAFYDSAYEPWSRILTGTLGQDPGWDPLEAMLQRAHAAGIQVHAWINTFPAWQSANAPGSSTPEHPLRANPSWLCANDNGVPMAPGESSYQFFSPGNPAVRAHIASVLEDLADKYEIDGLHLDYVRYPGPTYCHDAASEAEFARLRSADPNLSWGEFQRENVALTVEAVRTRVRAVRPNAVLSAATWGIYRNKWNWSSVSKGYDDYFQDAHGFIERGLLDALVPMTYWASTAVPGERLDFATLTEDHVSAARRAGRYAFAGISAEHDGAEISRQVQIARDKGARGMVFFEIGELRSQGHLARLRDGPFSTPAEVPPFAFRALP